MTQLIFSANARADIERLTDFLSDRLPYDAARTAGILANGLQILKRHPLIGRSYDADLRELVISRGNSGYLALYQYDEQADVVVIAAIRHQREAGYSIN